MSAVDLWYALPLEAADRQLLEAYDRLMSPEERNRETRFRFSRDRLRFRVRRALVRTVLSHYAPVAPSEWVFRVDDRGKPHVIRPSLPGLSFNLSHTDGLVACLVAFDREVGVDVENVTGTPPLEIADRVFAPPEVADLRALPAERQPQRFYEYWTLKESYIKARGLGLALPLELFSFQITPGNIRVRFDPSLGDDPASWWFALTPLTPSHLAAASIRRRAGEAAPPIDVWHVVPLGAEPVRVVSAPSGLC